MIPYTAQKSPMEYNYESLPSWCAFTCHYKHKHIVPRGGCIVPTWLSAGDRRLLQTPQRTIQADVVVAKNGSGNYTTITDALKSAPDKSNRRYGIHVKGGVDEENVVIKKKKTNLVVIGDGMNATVVTGSKNFVDGTTTFRSATFGEHGHTLVLKFDGKIDVVDKSFRQIRSI
eukprot:Gb_15172 [translate_table: standard]